MRSILFSISMFVMGTVVGCADLLGIEPWGESGSQNSSTAGGHTDTGSTGGIDPCHNQLQDGTETGVDCGGDTCAPCDEGGGCITDADCVSSYCPPSRGYCISSDGRAACGQASTENPTCGDCVKNGDETDIDCGGSTCLPCRSGKTCSNDSECWSGVCANGTCAPGTANTRCFSSSDCENGMTCAAAVAECMFDSCCRSIL